MNFNKQNLAPAAIVEELQQAVLALTDEDGWSDYFEGGAGRTVIELIAGSQVAKDVITFDYVENKLIRGDIFISTERVEDNAEVRKLEGLIELHRVIVHGVLHLLGYKDKSLTDIGIMREKESKYLELL